jgi:hypothetical protein
MGIRILFLRRNHILTCLFGLLFCIGHSLQGYAETVRSSQQLKRAQNTLIQAQNALDKKEYQKALRLYKMSNEIIPDVKNLMRIAHIQFLLGACSHSYEYWIKAYDSCDSCSFKPLILQRLKASTQKCTGMIEIKTIPSKANVYLNNEISIGITPLLFPFLHGSVKLTLTHPSFNPIKKNFQVFMNQKDTLVHAFKFSSPPTTRPSTQLLLNQPLGIKPESSIHQSKHVPWFTRIQTRGSSEREVFGASLMGIAGLTLITLAVFAALMYKNHSDVQSLVSSGVIERDSTNNSPFYTYQPVAISTGVIGSISLLGGIYLLWF